jgi:hypothetical protein
MNEDSPVLPHLGRPEEGGRYDAFVSAVTGECGKARDAVAAELRKLDFHVAVQSDFEQRPASVTTLQKLHDYISACDEVHCIIGSRSGEFPPPDAAAPFAGLLPAGITEASYTQWEYFFATRYVRDRLWLYIVTDAWRPDEAVLPEPDRPDSQRAFRAFLRGAGQDYAAVGTVGDVRAAVLAHHVRRQDADGAHGAGSHDPFHRAVAANAIGGVISGGLVALLIWAGSKLGGEVNPAVAALALLASGVGGLTFFVIYQRYAAILTRRGRHERAAYDRLRRTLAVGGLAAETYAHRLTAALDAVDRFFGDAGMASRTLFPRAFGLRTPAPLWTAPAFDRCLLLALIYPVATIYLAWVVSGHVGPAEHALLMQPDKPGWDRTWRMVILVVAAFSAVRADRSAGWRALVWMAVVAVVGIGGRVAGSVSGITGVFVGIILANGGALGITFFVTLTVMTAAIFSGTFGPTFANFLVIVFVVAASTGVLLAVTNLNERSTRGHWQGPFQVGLLTVLTIGCLVAAATLTHSGLWAQYAPLLLFLGLLTLLNAPFDWASLGLTRALLRRGLELGGWFPYLLAFADAMAAAGIIALLTLVAVLGVQMFDTLAAFSGGEGASILPLGKLFDGIRTNPAAPEFWWVYAMLLSTMIPSLINLTIAGGSLLRGIPWITTLLLWNMPEHEPPPTFDRLWITLLLTLQLFIGGLLGIAAQGFLVYVVMGLVLPWFGLDLLDLARGVAALDLPGALMRLAGMSPP